MSTSICSPSDYCACDREGDARPKRAAILLDRLGLGIFVTALAIFTFGIALRFADMPTRTVLNWAADDGFYYLQIARHIVAGDGSTFDGVAPTNGYHPAWMLVCTALARIVPNRYTLLHATIGAEFVCDAIDACLISILLRPMVGRFWALIGAALWLFNPLAIQIAVCLTEGPMCIGCALLAMVIVQRVLAATDRQSRRIAGRGLAAIGAGLAIAICGRTDAVIFAAVTVAFLVVWQSRGRKIGVVLAQAVRTVGVCGGVCALCMVPWLAYSWHSVHTVRQDSGVIKMLWQQPNIVGMSPLHLLVFGLRGTLLSWLGQTFFLTFGQSLMPALAADAVLAFLAAAAIYTVAKHRDAGEMAHWTAWLGATATATGFVYVVALAGHQLWHLAEPAIAVWLIVFGWSAILVRRYASVSLQAIIGASAAAYCCSAALAGLPGTTPRYPWQVDVYNSLPAFDRLVPPGRTVGCFNAGIPAYFGDRTVVNLDGLVNHDAVPYWTSHRFSAYVRAAGIHYIADEGYSIALGDYFSRRPLRLQVIATHPLDDPIRPLRYLCRVRD